MRADGSPHVVPIDGMGLDGAGWFGGHAVHACTLQQPRARDPRAALRLEDGGGRRHRRGPRGGALGHESEAEQLAAAAKAKTATVSRRPRYREGVWRLRPVKVMAWTELYRDTTRFGSSADSLNR